MKRFLAENVVGKTTTQAHEHIGLNSSLFASSDAS